MERASGDSEVLQMDWVPVNGHGGFLSGTYFFSVLTVILLICHRQMEDTTGTGPGLGHSPYVNNWTAPPGPLFPPPHPTLFDFNDFTTIPGPSHHHDTTSLSLPSDASDIDYFNLTAVGTTTSWDGNDLAVLDNFEKTFESYY